jgi:uncharacterized protein involved in exopolysaccharide biosynthesis
MRLLKLSIWIGLVAGALCACNKSEKTKVMPQAQEAPKPAAMVKDTLAGRSEVIAKLRGELDTLGMKIDSMKKKGAKTSAKTKRQMEKEMKALDEKRKDLAAKLGTMEKATVSAWDDLKGKTEKEIDDLKASVERLKKKSKL